MSRHRAIDAVTAAAPMAPIDQVSNPFASSVVLSTITDWHEKMSAHESIAHVKMAT